MVRSCADPTHLVPLPQDLAGRVAAVVDGGACACGVESTVLDGLRSPPVVLRPGGVTAEQLGLCPDMQGLQVSYRSSSSRRITTVNNRSSSSSTCNTCCVHYKVQTAHSATAAAPLGRSCLVL